MGRETYFPTRKTHCHSHLHALANLPPAKEPLLSTEEEDGWPPQPAWMFWTRETYLPARTETMSP